MRLRKDTGLLWIWRKRPYLQLGRSRETAESIDRMIGHILEHHLQLGRSRETAESCSDHSKPSQKMNTFN